MEQLNYGDRIYWNGLSRLESGIITGVKDSETLIVQTRPGYIVLVNVFSIKKVEHINKEQ